MLSRTHNGIELSEIGIGCYALSGAYGEVDPDQFKAVLRRAHELGVTFFDTADAYGDAERILGEVVRPYREEVLIATKVGVKEGAKPRLDAAYLKSSCEESLRKLGTGYIDLYQIHFDDPDTPVAETVSALEDLKRQGKIRRYGLGHLSPRRARAYLDEGSFFSILMELSAVSRHTYGEFLPLRQEHDFGIIAFSVTGRGLLTGKYQESPSFEQGDIRNLDALFQRERFQHGLRVMEKLAELGKRHGMTPAQAAIAWVLAQEGVICALTGPSTLSHLEENLAASGWLFTAGEKEELDRFLSQEREIYRQQARESVKEILKQTLPADPMSAFKDLIYAIETGLQLGLLHEPDVLPVFYDLYSLRDDLSEHHKPQLTRIRKRIKTLLEA